MRHRREIDFESVNVSLDEPPAGRERMHVVIGGHVDHGKSTIVGRLLADTQSLPRGRLEQVKALCERTARPFEYAFLLDALREERAQGITIDAARMFFKTAARDYLIIDAPGHVEFLKNMVTGAARAEAALLVIDAREGVRDNSRRHGFMLSMLGIRQITVLVNKMDVVGHDQDTFDRLEAEYRAFLGRLNLSPMSVIPVCGRHGDNIAARSASMPWYHGPTLLETLDRFSAEPPAAQKPFRMPVQDVYKFTNSGDDRRIVAGTVETGTVRLGDEIVFYPSGKKGVVRSFERFNQPPPITAAAGEATGLTLAEHIFVSRGEVATIACQPRPHVTTRLRASVFWLGTNPLVLGKDYLLRLGTACVTMQLEQVQRVIDASDLSSLGAKQRIDRNEVADCTLHLDTAIAFDVASDIATTGRFAIVDDHDIRGGGLVREALADEQAWVREKVLIRNYRWQASAISPDRRAVRFGQRPALLLITGPAGIDRKPLARALELHLFDQGRLVYFLGIGNVLYGVDADIANAPEHRHEHMRRLAEIANLMLDAGTILIVTAIELRRDDLDVITATIDADRIDIVWVGGAVTTDVTCDLVLGEHANVVTAVDRMTTLLRDKGTISGTV
jgi:bifunctional enzyme CysN/CysC